MEKLKKSKPIVLLIVLCMSVLLGVLLFNLDFSAKHASAEDDVGYSIEDDLTFSLFNDGTEYKVGARNKQMTDVVIPSVYNGLPVTEISNNGFMNCTSLKSARIPQTVTRIGNNAFANCKNLEKVSGMARVEEIGNNAFAMCSSLDNLKLPSTLNTLGKNIINKNEGTVYSRKSEAEMYALNSAWDYGSTSIIIYGQGLVLNEIYDDAGEELIGYSIADGQNLEAEDTDFVLGDTYNGKPLLEIEEYAFWYSTFKSFTLKHGEIIPDAESSDEVISTHDLDCDHVVNIASGAFNGITVEHIDLLVDITFNDEDDGINGKSTDVFSGSTMEHVTLPDNIGFIPYAAFSGCENLSEIWNVNRRVPINTLSSNIVAVYDEAFSGCKALTELNIPDSVTTMGNAVFNQWGDSNVEQTIIFNNLCFAPVEYEGYNWDTYWLGTTGKNVVIKFETLTVVLDKDGGKDDVGTVSVEAVYNNVLPKADAPERDHYIFKGYYSQRNGVGTMYYDEEMNSVSVWDKKTAGSIYAYWVPHLYEITFDKQGGSGGTDKAFAQYDMPMPDAKMPERLGFTFLGYFSLLNEKKEQYYDKNMNSVKPWDIEQNTTLYALWDLNEYTVQFDLQNDDPKIEKNLHYGDVMPEMPKPQKTGCTFAGYYTEPDGNGVKYYNRDMTHARAYYDIDDDSTLYAYWTPIPYSLNFYVNDELQFTSIVNYDSELPTDIVIELPANFKLKGFFTEPDGNGTKYYDTDMNPLKKMDFAGNLNLYAARMTIKINYVLNGGVNHEDNPSSVNYYCNVKLKDPEKRGYHFVGWFCDGVQVTTLRDPGKEEITLAAAWEGHYEALYIYDHTVNVYNLSYVILELPDILGFHCDINIYDDVKQVYIFSTYKDVKYNLNIIIQSRYTDFTLILEDVILAPGISQSYEQKPVIVMYTDNDSALNLYTYGTVSILGSHGFNKSGKGGCGGCAIQCSTLYIRHIDDLKLVGGDGINGTGIFSNGYGGYAVIARNNVFIVNQGNFSATNGSLNGSTTPFSIQSGNTWQYIEE